MNAGLAWERKLKKLGVPMSPRPSKYHARATTVNGIRFDSAKEARRYQELKLLEKAGKIFRLQLQPRYRLNVWPESFGAPMAHVGEYVADFRYCETKDCACAWGCQIEDVKGYRTPLFRWKKKHAELQYRIVIHEL